MNLLKLVTTETNNILKLIGSYRNKTDFHYLRVLNTYKIC